VSTPAEKRADSIKGFWRMIIGFVIVWIICVVVWALTGQGYFWPMWPALGLTIGAITSGIRIFGMPKS
jgi:H+/Cl- antiporter ClcA